MDPQQITVVALVFGIGAAGLAKKWVFGWIYEAAIASLLKQLADMTADRNFWRDSTLAAMRHTDKALDVVQAQKTTPDG